MTLGTVALLLKVEMSLVVQLYVEVQNRDMGNSALNTVAHQSGQAYRGRELLRRSIL